MNNRFLLLLLLPFALQSCVASMKVGKPEGHYSESPKPPAPDYSQLQNWAAHPDKKDNSDLTPSDSLKTVSNGPVDIFFIYPTIFTATPQNEYQWNASVNDEKLNGKIDNTTILFQASVYNGAGNIYAPRHRQAHIAAFTTSFQADRDSSLNLAYQDVKKAFEYYLEHWNNGKPFILASHSQGTVHAVRLIRELVEGKALQEQLVAAYLIGMPVSKTSFTSLSPCNNPDDTGCIISWCTYARDYYPTHPAAYLTEEKRAALISVNPLTWKTDDKMASYELNKGGVLRDLKKVYPGMSDAQNHQGMLWIDPPKFPGSSVVKKVKNFHIGDYNLFYLNIRENAILRTKTYLEKQ